MTPMHNQQQHENILFAAAPFSKISLDDNDLNSSQAGASAKRPISISVKSSRSARLGAAAAAAVVACGAEPLPNPDSDEEGSGGRGLVSPTPISGAVKANGLIYSLLGSMPSLPGSPNLVDPETPTSAPSRLLKQSSALAICRGVPRTGVPRGAHRTVSLRTDPGGGRPQLAKCMSDRVIASGQSGVGGGRGSGMASATDGYGALAASTALVALRALARKSVDAAADAETLATRQVSTLTQPMSKNDGLTSHGVTAPSISQRPPHSATYSRAVIPSGPGDGAASSPVTPSAAPALLPVMGAGGAAGVLPGATIAASSRFRDWSSFAVPRCTFRATAAGVSASLGSALPKATLPPRESGRRSEPVGRQLGQSMHSTTSAAVPVSMTASAVGPDTADSSHTAGLVRQPDSERKHHRPRWLERLLMVFKIFNMHRGEKVGGGGGGGKRTERVGGGGGGGAACVRLVGMGGGNVNDGPVDGQSYLERLERGSRDMVGHRDVVRGSSRCGGGNSGDGAVAADDDDAAVGLPASFIRGGGGGGSSGGSAKDSFMFAGRLLSSRLTWRPRSGSEERPPSVMTSCDSTTIHRARLAHHAIRASGSLTRSPPAVTTTATLPAVVQPDLPSPDWQQYSCKSAVRSSSGITLNSSMRAPGVIVGGHTATTGNLTLATTLTMDGTAATGNGTSYAGGAEVVDAAAVVVPELALPLTSSDMRHVCVNPPQVATTCRSVRTATLGFGEGGSDTDTGVVVVSSRSRTRRRKLLRSVPGGSEQLFTSLDKLETCCDDGATAAFTVAHDDGESHSLSDEEDRSLELALRTSAMTFHR